MDEKLKECKTITMRISSDILEKIDKEAQLEHRNRTQQILHMIDRYYELKKLLDK